MTIWTPELDRTDETPLYVAIADAIEADVADGTLEAGARLPTHRALARTLDVTVGTVTRGYGEAERRGLVVGEVGRGTFVAEPDPEDEVGAPDADTGEVDLRLSLPLQVAAEREALRSTLAELGRERGSGPSALLRYQPGTAPARHREVGSRWIGRTGLEAPPERVVVTAGTQHALTVAFSNLLRPGDTVLAAALTYPGARELAQMLGLRLRGVAVDAEGLVPEALEEAAREEAAPRAVYLVPTIQNPRSGTLSPERRRAVARIAREHDLLILEDDVHAFLPPETPEPIAALAPERTLYFSSVGKALSLGLRTGFVLCPGPYVERLVSGVRSTMWMPPPLMVEVATRWIRSGAADEILAQKRRENRERHRLLDACMGDRRIDRDPHGLHAWLHLPEPWRSDDFVNQARQRGVLVAGASAFAVGRSEVPHAVRISLTASTAARTRSGLETLAELLDGGAEACVSVL